MESETLISHHLPSNIILTDGYDEKGGWRFMVGEEERGDLETASDTEGTT